MNEEFKCDFCGCKPRTLYVGWFYTDAKLNGYAKGTASSGLMQNKRACRYCAQQAIDLGLHEAKELPDDEQIILSNGN